MKHAHPVSIVVLVVLGTALYCCGDDSTNVDSDAGPDTGTGSNSDTDTGTDSSSDDPEPESGLATVPETDIVFGYLVPPSYDPEAPTPVLYSMHPYGGVAQSMLNVWSETAVEHGFILLTLESADTTWTWPSDNDRFYEMVEHTDSLYNIDATRRYLQGYSAGGHYSYALGLLDNQFFAAFAVFAGSMDGAIEVGVWPLDYDSGERKIPVCIHHSTDDPSIQFSEALDARQALEAAGHEVFFGEIEGSGHSYDADSNQEAWEFVSQFALLN